MPAVVMLASMFAYGGDIPSRNVGQSGRSTSARLTISAIVAPIIQTSPLTAPRIATNEAITYNLAGRRREHRYDLRTLPAEKTSGVDLHGAAVLQTLTIVAE